MRQLPTQPPLRVFATVSGKGGVGKTNLASNMAVVAAQDGRRVLVVDADLGLSNIEIALGVKPRYHIGDLIDGTVEGPQVLTRGPAGVHVLSAGSGLQALTHLDDAQKLRVITLFDQIGAGFDTVIIDGGAGIGDNVLFFVGAAQEALLVVSPEPTSLTDAYATVKVLCQRGGVKQFNVVVNPGADERAARQVYEKLVSVTNRFLHAKLCFLGFLPRDENLHRAVMLQRPLVEAFPESPASQAIGRIARRLLASPPPADLDGGLKFMWQRLFQDAAASARV